MQKMTQRNYLYVQKKKKNSKLRIAFSQLDLSLGSRIWAQSCPCGPEQREFGVLLWEPSGNVFWKWFLGDNLFSTTNSCFGNGTWSLSNSQFSSHPWENPNWGWIPNLPFAPGFSSIIPIPLLVHKNHTPEKVLPNPRINPEFCCVTAAKWRHGKKCKLIHGIKADSAFLSSSQPKFIPLPEPKIHFFFL